MASKSSSAESDVVATEVADGAETEGADDAEREVDESEGTKLVEGTIPLEGTVDEEDTNDGVSASDAGAVARLRVWPKPIWRSFPSDPGAWHSGCRGPSPLVEAWVVRLRH